MVDGSYILFTDDKIKKPLIEKKEKTYFSCFNFDFFTFFKNNNKNEFTKSKDNFEHHHIYDIDDLSET